VVAVSFLSVALSNFITLICYVTVKTEADTVYDGPWVTDVLPEEVVNCYRGWEPDLMQLLEVRSSLKAVSNNS
jgi:salicylate hydroxylase